MGQGGKIKIENKTDSKMIRRYCEAYQMDAWSFPETIEANSSATIYVEWDECIFHAKGVTAVQSYTILVILQKKKCTFLCLMPTNEILMLHV